MGENSVRIAVAAHKAYAMPADQVYLPLHVGAALAEDFHGESCDPRFAEDDSGENISELNPGFCELTGLFWEWKNLKEDFVGLVHYRRHFAAPGRSGKNVDDAISGEELKPLLGQYLVFVPKKRWYVVETLYTHYAHTHYAGHLDETRRIILERCPEYLASFDAVMQQRKGHMFNMMIMHRECADSYCSWLFPILFELKDRLEERGGEEIPLSGYQGRLYGRVSELLLNVWLRCQTESGAIGQDRICELPFFGTEKTDWVKKGAAFLRAKVLHEKYRGSF